MKLFASFILLLSLACAAAAQTPKRAMTAAEISLAAVDRQLQDAIVAGDAKIIDRFLADDVIFVHGFFDGPSQTKNDFLASAKLDPKPYLFRKVSSQIAEIHGNFGMVIGRLDIRRHPNPKANETSEMCYAINFVHLFDWRKKRWQLVSHRAAQVLDPPKACE